MNHQFFSVIVKVFLLISFAQVFAQEPITLEQAIEVALKKNIENRKLQLNEIRAETNLSESKLLLLPKVNAGSNMNLNFGRTVDPFSYQFVNQHISSSNGSINATIPIFQGFQNIQKIAQNKLLLEAEKNGNRKFRNELALNVIVSYLQVLNYKDVLAVAVEQLDLAKQQLASEELQYKLGNKTSADMSQTKLQVANAQLNFVQADNKLNMAFLNLAQLMNLNPTSKFDVIRPDLDSENISSINSPDSLYLENVESYPNVRLAKIRALSAQREINIAKGALFPRLTFQASVASGYSSVARRTVFNDVNYISEKVPLIYQINKNLNQTIGFSLSVPVFNGLGVRLSIKKAKLDLYDAQFNELLERNNFNKIIHQAVADLQAAKQTYETMQSALEASKDAFKSIKQKYAIGVVSAMDFNRAQAELNQVEFNVIQSHYDMLLKYKVVGFYLHSII